MPLESGPQANMKQGSLAMLYGNQGKSKFYLYFLKNSTGNRFLYFMSMWSQLVNKAPKWVNAKLLSMFKTML